jgi:hypothetical protein
MVWQTAVPSHRGDGERTERPTLVSVSAYEKATLPVGIGSSKAADCCGVGDDLSVIGGRGLFPDQ